MDRDIFHPEFKAMPYWWEDFRPTAEGSVAPPAKCDVAIVGGGYAGLASALALARGGASAAVLEAAEFGHGASTRSGGAVSAGINLAKGLSGRAGKGDRAAWVLEVAAMMRDAASAFDTLETLIARERIACCYERSGRFIGAYTQKHYDDLAQKLDAFNSHAEAGAKMLPRERQREEIASDFYRGGMVVERSGKLHPALYYKGLFEAARGAGVSLSAMTPVARIARRTGGFTLKTPKGEIAAREVVIATNGYTGNATPSLKRRVIPVASHIIATEPLPPGLAASLIPKGRTISDTPRILTYYRLSPDGTRVVFGGRARFTEVPPEVSAPVLYRFMTARFPQLEGTRITHAWSGNVAFTFDYLPHMGKEDGMHYALGCNGSGVATMSYLGSETGRKILGGANRVNALDGRDFPTRPFYGGKPWFLPLVGGYYRLRDRLDRMTG